MPIYAFFCDRCSKSVDKQMPMNEVRDQEKCEKCGGWMRRMYTPPGIQIN